MYDSSFTMTECLGLDDTSWVLKVTYSRAVYRSLKQKLQQVTNAGARRSEKVYTNSALHVQ